MLSIALSNSTSSSISVLEKDKKVVKKKKYYPE